MVDFEQLIIDTVSIFRTLGLIIEAIRIHNIFGLDDLWIAFCQQERVNRVLSSQTFNAVLKVLLIGVLLCEFIVSALYWYRFFYARFAPLSPRWKESPLIYHLSRSSSSTGGTISLSYTQKFNCSELH
jgi:hypothetical protein